MFNNMTIGRKVAVFSVMLMLLIVINSVLALSALLNFQRAALQGHEQVTGIMKEGLSGEQGEELEKAIREYEQTLSGMSNTARMTILMMNIISIIIGVMMTFMVVRSISVARPSGTGPE